MDEGETYTFGDLDVQTQLEKLSGERLALILGIKKGDQFRAKSIQDAIDTLDLRSRHRAATPTCRSVPVEHRDPVNHTIGLTFQVDEGARVYIERIDIVRETRRRSIALSAARSASPRATSTTPSSWTTPRTASAPSASSTPKTVEVDR